MEEPVTDSDKSESVMLAEAVFPAKTFIKSIALYAPTPDNCDKAWTWPAEGKSLSFKRDLPPKLLAKSCTELTSLS